MPALVFVSDFHNLSGERRDWPASNPARRAPKGRDFVRCERKASPCARDSGCGALAAPGLAFSPCDRRLRCQVVEAIERLPQPLDVAGQQVRPARISAPRQRVALEDDCGHLTRRKLCRLVVNRVVKLGWRGSDRCGRSLRRVHLGRESPSILRHINCLGINRSCSPHAPAISIARLAMTSLSFIFVCGRCRSARCGAGIDRELSGE